MTDSLLIQEKINYYSCYTKHLISGFCEEFNTNKVHAKRLTSVIERLLANENTSFLTFFKDEKVSVPYKILQYLNAQGEILHVGENYYTLPPERVIELPDGQQVLLSSVEITPHQVGLGRLIEEQVAISLRYDEYVYMPTFEQIIQHFEKQLTNHHDVEPSEIIQFTERGSFILNNLKRLVDGEYYLLKSERLIGAQIKPERYFAKWQNQQWLVAEIKNGLFVRTRMALRSRKNLYSTYWFTKRSSGFIEVNLQHALPKEEDALMRLIATPNENKWPKNYLTTELQLENIRAILAHCKLKEVTENAIHN